MAQLRNSESDWQLRDEDDLAYKHAPVSQSIDFCAPLRAQSQMDKRRAQMHTLQPYTTLKNSYNDLPQTLLQRQKELLQNIIPEADKLRPTTS